MSSRIDASQAETQSHDPGTFKLALLQKYGDMVTAWFQCVDAKREGRIQELLPQLRRLGMIWEPPRRQSLHEDDVDIGEVTFLVLDLSKIRFVLNFREPRTQKQPCLGCFEPRVSLGCRVFRCFQGLFGVQGRSRFGVEEFRKHKFSLCSHLTCMKLRMQSLRHDCATTKP